MNVKAGSIFDAISTIVSASRQVLPLPAAEQISDFNEALSVVIEEIERSRQEILAGIGESEEEKAHAQELFEKLTEREFTLPEIEFSEFKDLRLSAEGITLLKRMGAY